MCRYLIQEGCEAPAHLFRESVSRRLHARHPLIAVSTLPFPPFAHDRAALLYLNPALLGSAFATALLNGNGELKQLLAFGIGDSSEPSSKDEA